MATLKWKWFHAMINFCLDLFPGPDAITIVLVGKTGVGKSAAGNTILRGRNVFKEGLSLKPITTVCQKETDEVDKRQITVIDTPALFNSETGQEEVTKEIRKSVSMASPGPYIFLLVLRVAQRRLLGNKELKRIQNIFGEQSVRYTMVLFTAGDVLGKTPIEQYLEESGSEMLRLIEECGNRYHVFNNKERRDHSQVTDLLHRIYHMMEMNGGSCYTNKMFQQVEIEKHEEQERILRIRVTDLEKQEMKLETQFSETRKGQKDPELRTPNEEESKAKLTAFNQSKAAPERDADNVQKSGRGLRRIVLLGKNGAEKSAAGNIILGEERFGSEFSSSSKTWQCEKHQGEVSGKIVSVVNTPQLFDKSQLSQKLAAEIGKSVYFSSPGTHAFLYVVSFHNRFTETDREFEKQVEPIFGKEIGKYTIILFTRVEELKGRNVFAEIRRYPALNRLIDQCRGYHIFYNDDQSNRQQVTELLHKIDKMVEDNKERHYHYC